MYHTTSGREFIQQFSDQILSFTIKVKCPKTGEEIEARFTRLVIDPCIYRYEDVMGRIMLILHCVDDIIAVTTDQALRERYSLIKYTRSGQSLSKVR